jgi:hypothetical protein
MRASNYMVGCRAANIRVLPPNEGFKMQSFVTGKLKKQVSRIDKLGYEIHICAPRGFDILHPNNDREYVLSLEDLESKLRELV